MMTAADLGVPVTRWVHPDYLLPRRIRVEKIENRWHAWVVIGFGDDIHKWSATKGSAVNQVEKALWKRGWKLHSGYIRIGR